MKKKVFVYGLFLIVIALFQMNIADRISVFGVKPNLYAVFIIVVGLINGSNMGAIIGFLVGLVQDSFSSTPIGLYALIGMYIGLMTGMVRRSFFQENYLLTIFFTFIYTIVYETIVVFLALSAAQWQAGFGAVFVNYLYLLRTVILFEAIYNLPFAVVMHILCFKYLIVYERSGLRYRGDI